MVKVTFGNKKPAQKEAVPVSPTQEKTSGVKVTFPKAESTQQVKPFGTTPKASAPQQTRTTKQSDATSPMFRAKDGIGQYGKGNVDLYNRPKYRNKDGSILTVDSASYNIDGKEVLLPSVWNKDGAPYHSQNDEEILQHYEDTGEYLGKFSTAKEADDYAEKLHLEQQKRYTGPFQSTLAQDLAQGALQQREAKNYQSEDAFNQHVQDVKTPTVAQRVGNMLKGSGKTYGAGFVNLGSMVAHGQVGTAMSQVYSSQVEMLDEQIAALEATLSDPTMTAQDIANTEEAIANAKAQRDLYAKSVESGERTAEEIYKVADAMADSGAKDIQQAKKGLGKAGQLAVDVGVAGTQMAADAALGAVTGGSALAPMFVRSAGGGAQEARRQGATHEQQVNYGFASGALSVATEKIGNAAAPFKKMFGKGFLDDVIERAMQGLNSSAAGKIALSFLEEGGEEAIEDLIQPALQMIYNGKTLGGSYSELEASEILNDFLVGGILGGLGGGVEAIGNRGGRYYDSRTELPKTQTETRSDAEIVNGIADRLFARYDSMIGESGRKAIRGSYQEGKDTAEHVKDFIPAYNAGVEGKANPNPTNETAYAGYAAGQNDAKTEARRKTFAQENDGDIGLVYDDYVSREMDNATADEINTVAKALGVRVRMADEVRGGTANGVIEGNEIRIAKDAQDPVMQVVGHEWTHRVQDLAPEQYTAFRNAIMEDPDVAEAANILHEQYNRMGVKTSMDEALDEAAANYAGEMIANTDVLNEFIRRHSEDRTLLEKLRDAIREIVGKLTGKAKKQAQTAEGLLQQAFEAAAKNNQNTTNEGDTKRYSLKPVEDYIANLDDTTIEDRKKDISVDEAIDALYAQKGLSYRFYNDEDPMSRAGYAMFSDDPDANGSAYGGNHPKAFSVDENALTDISDITQKIIDARHNTDEKTPWILEDYEGVSDEEFAALSDPDDIVDSAAAYDDEALTSWLWDNVLEPNDIKGIKTNDGAVAFSSDIIKRNLAAEVAFDQSYSLKGTENAQELAALKRENETLRQRVDYWKGQTRRSEGVRTDSKSVQQAAKKLVKDYSAEIDSSEIAGDLASLYDYIARGGDETGELTYTEARSRADSIAERIAESTIAKDDEIYREYSELRKFLKDTKLTLSAEDAAGITNYADLRRGLFGKVNLGKGERTNVDQVYSELAESYPEFFSETHENNVSDQINRIAEVANELYNVGEYNPFEGYMGQAVSAISNDIMERFFDLPQAKKTFADVQAEKLEVAKAAGRKASADAKLAGQMAQGRTDAARLRRTQEALQKARAQRVEELEALRNRYATRREGQKRRELRAKITRHAKDLSKKLLRPTDAKHIPDNMRSSVAAVLNSINQESAYSVDKNGMRVHDGSGTPTQRTETFRALQEQYQAILKDNEGGDMVIDPSLLGTDGSDGLIGQVIKMGDRRLPELTQEELGTMWKTIRAVEHSVSTAGKALSKSKFETTKQMADAFKTDVSTRRQKLGGNMTISLETPYTFFAHYGETGKNIYRMLRNAQDQQEVMARDIAEKTQKVLGDELGEAGFKDVAGRAIRGDLKGALRDARGSAIGKWEAETHDITVANGGKLTLTTPQIMELYLLSKRKQALGHLLGGGVIQPEIKSAETGKTKIQRGTMQVFLTEGDIERITSKLTDEQKRVADGLQDLTATTLAKYGNDASMQAYGYRKFTEENYWPIKSAKEGLHSTQEKDSGNVRSIKNIGMAQQVTPNANNAVELRSVFDTFADHASDMIDYAAWLAPMEDANRFFNFQYRNDAGNKTGVSVKGLLDEKGGKGAQQYWTKLMGDIQNGIGAKDFEPMTDKFAKGVGKFKGAAVGANIRVVIQQPTAFFRAAAVLDPKDMAKGMAGGVTKGNGWEKALEHSPIAMRKDVGSFDIASPYTLKERFYGKEGVTNKLNDLAGAAAGKADAVTWGKLWNACEWQVKREKPNVRAGSNEFYSAVNDVFSDMIDQTQVVDGILQRSNIMRGKSTLSQQATAFMGEPIMSLNVLMRSYDAFRYEENPAKRSKALKNVGRAATALVVTNVVNALAQSVVDGLRDDDRDKDYWEKFLSAFTGVEGDENSAFELISHIALDGNVGSNMNPVTQIPFAKDVLSLIQGYDVSRPDMEVFSDLVNATKTFIDSAGGSGKKTRKEATLTLLAAASKFFGLPVSNIKRDVMATIRTIAQASGSFGFQYEVEKFSYNLENSSNRSRFISILYDALEQGDYATYERIRRDLMERMGLDGESIQSSLKGKYKKALEKDEDYHLPQKAMDALGLRDRYVDEEEKDDFTARDLNAGAYSKYESQKSDVYRTQADKATSNSVFPGLSDEGKDNALNYVESYAEKTALKDNSGGKYEITTKWIQKAQEAQKKYHIDPGVFAVCKAAASECESLKDKDGETINLSKGLQIMEMLFRSGLTEKQRTAMYEYLSVPKSIRHWNRARVDEQLAIMRKKAA